MKKLIFSLSLVSFIISCSGNEESEERNGEAAETHSSNQAEEVEIVNSFIISEDVVGIFELSEVVPEKLPNELSIRQFIEKDRNEEGEMIEHIHNVIFNQLEDVLELIMSRGGDEHHEDKLIQEMLVLSDYYETREGIGVGTAIEKFQETYPDAMLWYARISNRYIIETETILRAQFILSESDCVKKPEGKADMEKLTFGHFQEGAKIQKIRLY